MYRMCFLLSLFLSTFLSAPSRADPPKMDLSNFDHNQDGKIDALDVFLFLDAYKNRDLYQPTDTPTSTLTPTPSFTVTASITPTNTPSATPSNTLTATSTPTLSNTPSITPTPTTPHTPTATRVCQIVEIPDPYLELKIRKQLNIYTEPLTDCDLETITSFTGGYEAITNLDGLQYMLNLTSLHLEWNRITDITPLANLTQLRKIDLSNSLLVSNIEPLSKLINLDSFIMPGAQVSDISPLRNLTQLETLDLNNQNGTPKLSDISPIADLVELNSLALGGNNISDISALANLTKLHYLMLNVNVISDITPLMLNPGIGLNDTIEIDTNPLDATAECIYIPHLLFDLFVNVRYTHTTTCE